MSFTFVLAGTTDCDSTDSEEAEEIDALKREANMPIDELIASNYPDPAKVRENIGKIFSPNLKPKKENNSNSPIKIDLNGEDQENEGLSSSSANNSLNSSNNSCPSATADKSPPKPKLEVSTERSLSNGKVGEGEEKLTEEEQPVAIVNNIEDTKVNGEVTPTEPKEDDKKRNGNSVEESKRESDEVVAVSEEHETIGYIGKGKSGGKGGKVKGKSAITTTKIQTKKEVKQTRIRTATKTSIEEAKKVVLSDEDLDSEEDEEEEQDATFAPE